MFWQGIGGMKLECASINLSRTHVSQFLGTTSHLLPCCVHWTPDVNPSVGSKSQPITIQMMLVEATYQSKTKPKYVSC
jgi:hypothetical protein